jgi:NAD(P)-dependent dehydrogenase (short-subunit alcohol dehydrogenase family)
VLAGAGAQVVASARRIDRLEELSESEAKIDPVQADVTVDEDRQRLVATTLERYGRVDILVNNAGMGSGGPEQQSSLDVFRSVLALNLEAVFGLCQVVAEPMRAQGSGSIINIGSMFGLVASVPVADAGYVASKSAVNGLTRELANQWGTDGVRVNAIAPGWFRTEMTTELFDDEKTQRWLARQLPLGRPGQIDELDGVLLFLASDASSYCTGQVIAIDGGYTIR